MLCPPGGTTVSQPTGPWRSFSIISGVPISFIDPAHGNMYDPGSTPWERSDSRTRSSLASFLKSPLWIGIAMWKIELTTNTNTPDTMIGSHNSVRNAMCYLSVSPDQCDGPHRGPYHSTG